MFVFPSRAAVALVAIGLVTLAAGQDAGEETAGPPEPRDPVQLLLDEIDTLHATIDTLRSELARARLEAAAANRELDELRQFIRDHDAYGPDFERYEGIRAAGRIETQRRRTEAAREQAAARRAEREARYQDAKTRRARERAEIDRINEYRDAGFLPLGFDVFLSQMAFYYPTDDTLYARVRFNPLGRRFLSVHPGTTIDYSEMTISGSVLNTSGVVRDLGIAVTFFDEAGSQVGAEIVQVANARPDVPYPFTATVSMALDRPFTSSSSYVLYADPVEP